MQLAALLLIGFSVFTAALLIIGNILQQMEPHPFSSKLAGFVLVISLAAIQWLYLQFILDQSDQVFSPYIYSAALLCRPQLLFLQSPVVDCAGSV